jgi:hypothetical protein
MLTPSLVPVLTAEKPTAVNVDARSSPCRVYVSQCLESMTSGTVVVRLCNLISLFPRPVTVNVSQKVCKRCQCLLDDVASKVCHGSHARHYWKAVGVRSTSFPVSSPP